MVAVSSPSNGPVNARENAESWLDLSGRIFRQILLQPYESHLSGSVTSLASDLLSNLEALLEIYDTSLRAISCLINIIMLVRVYCTQVGAHHSF